MAKYKGMKMPNESRGGGSKGHMKSGSGPMKSGGNYGLTTGLRKSNEMRKDMMTTPSHKNPYPTGLA